jgi:glutamine synthetase
MSTESHDYLYATYIWIDGGSPTQTLRSKTRVILDVGDGIPKVGSATANWGLDHGGEWDWSFDGSSTMQADGDSSDCVLKPIRFFRDPLRPRTPCPETGEPRHHLLVLCEVFGADGEPHPSNYRARLRDVEHAVDEGLGYNAEDPTGCWFGYEQEYTLFKGSRPLGFGEDRRFPAAQGPYYCGVGADEVKGRELVEEHMEMCARAGIHLTGINAEVMPGQWEFQVGGPGAYGTLAGDHLWMARWLLYRLGEKYGIHATLDPKPVPGDWNGAGMHTNFSTPLMREDGGLRFIHDWCETASKRVSDHLPEYGDGIEMRLTGKHETCSHREFKWGVSDRTASIRIPIATAKAGKGYLEDRRPNANACPYRVAAAMLKTAYGLWGLSHERPEPLGDNPFGDTYEVVYTEYGGGSIGNVSGQMWLFNPNDYTITTEGDK